MEKEHTTLYRKYRPQKFSEVLGQDHVVDVLKSSLKEGKTTHAYLFSGPRGTGKTSIARILANELKCSSNDLFEIDGASNRGIDEVRELRESVKTLPFDSPVKVYVIDEVHMLTREAFNALLKTLEEPPEFVVFMLATTELHKVPETIISRCQSFVLKKPTENILKDMVESVAKSEKANLDDEASALIAFLGEGSYRDAQGVLEQILGLSDGKKITREMVARVTGAPSKELIHDFVSGILDGDLDRGLSAIAGAKEKNIDMKVYARLLLKHLRYIMLIALAPDARGLIESEIGEDEFKYLSEMAKHENKNILPGALKALIGAYDDIRHSYIEELPLELALVKIVGQKE